MKMFMDKNNNYLVFDIGGSNIKYGLINHSGKLLFKHHFITPKTNLNDFANSLKNVIQRYQNCYRGIAFSIPGTIDHQKNEIKGGGNLRFLDGQSLQKILNIDSKAYFNVENDGKAAALAEKWSGNLKGYKNGVAIVLGTGVGGGIILNDDLYFGSHFQAGEFSFMIKKFWKNQTEKYGQICSAVLMVEQASQLLNLSSKRNGEKVFEYINRKDLRVQDLFESYCTNIAILISNIQVILDVECFVIGGGISVQPIVTKTINYQYQLLRKNYPSLDNTISNPKIVSSKFHNDANLYGAFYSLLLKYDD